MKKLNIYFTAGIPTLEDTAKIMKTIQNSGADMMEIGMPYSDPVADGPVIQEAHELALSNGMTIAQLFSQLKSVKDEINIPVILMGYINPVLSFGFEKFCEGRPFTEMPSLTARPCGICPVSHLVASAQACALSGERLKPATS